MATMNERWEDLGGGSRSGLILGLIVILVFTMAAAIWLLRDEKQVLFSALEAQDAAAVVAELERLKLDYALADGGAKILVPGSEVHETRLKLMGSGMPMSGGVGFELFDDSDFGMTEFAQRINFQRAMQGELARTIMSHREVKHARIHLVMPEGGLFRRAEETPSAAVNLVMAGAAVMSTEQVLGIQRLVAAAVQGLQAPMVTIIDQNGMTLSKPVIADGEIAAATARLARKQEVEAYLTAKVMTMIEHSLGPDQAVVSIDVSLNMNQVRRTLENVRPQQDGTGIVKLKRESRNWGGDGEARKDGAVTTETQYDLGREVEQIVEMPGSIRRISVGVIVSDTLSAESLAKLEELVTMAIGLDPARGDSIALHAIAAADLERVGGGAAALMPTPPSAPAPTATDVALAQAPDGWQAAQPGETLLGGLPLRYWLVGSLAALALLSALSIWQFFLLRRQVGHAPARLSSAEREQMVAQLRGWFEGEAATQGGAS